MKHGVALAFVSLLTALSLHGAAAHGQTEATRRVFGVRVEPYGGIVWGSGGGLGAGVAAFAQYGIFQVGGFYEATLGGVLGANPHFVGWGGAAGVRLSRGVARFDLLASMGTHQFSDIGARGTSGLFNAVRYADGVDGATLFLGFRGGISAEWGRIVRFSIGGRLSVESDLSREERMRTVYSYPNGPPMSCLWSCGDLNRDRPTVTSQEPVTLGGVQVGVMLVLSLRVGGDERAAR